MPGLGRGARAAPPTGSRSARRSVRPRGRVLLRRLRAASGAHAGAGWVPRGGSLSGSGSPDSPRCASSRAGLGAGTPRSLPLSLPRSGARRAARLQAPRPRGEQWARVEAALRPRRSENRSGAQSARPARLPGVRPAGRRAVSLSRRLVFVASRSRARLASSGRARPAGPGAPAAAKRSPAARRAYISGRLPRSALRQRSAPAPRNIHEAAAARGLP